MIELAAILLSAIGLTAAGLGLLGLLSRRSRRRPHVARRAVAMGLVALPLVLAAAWKISKSRDFQFFGEIVPRVSVPERVVALTFDDGPTPELAPRILSILAEEGVKATFFVTGAELEKNPDLGRRIVAAGHELGNHSYSHPQMLGRSYDYVRREVERTDALIRAAGHEGPIHFRPPYCKKLLVLPYYLAARGRKTITCDVEPESYPAVAAESPRIVEHVRERARPGSIILLHVMYPSRRPSLEAVPGIIRALRADGYRFVTVSQLLEYRRAGHQPSLPPGHAGRVRDGPHPPPRGAEPPDPQGQGQEEREAGHGRGQPRLPRRGPALRSPVARVSAGRAAREAVCVLVGTATAFLCH